MVEILTWNSRGFVKDTFMYIVVYGNKNEEKIIPWLLARTITYLRSTESNGTEKK